MIEVIKQLLALATLVTHIVIIALLALYLLQRTKKNTLFDTLKKMISPFAYHLVFLSTLTAMLGSLFFSEIAKFQPCILCWYQRIFMYPQPFLVYLAVIRNEFILTPYLILLNVLGGLISIYHYAIQLNPKLTLSNCSVNGGVDCIKGYQFYFGYISIPLEAFTVSLFNVVILLLLTKKIKK